MINYDSILSAFDGKPTLLQWLKMVKKALDESVLKDITVSQDGASAVFTFNFEDGTSISTPAVTLPKGDTGAKGDKGDKGEQGVSVTGVDEVSNEVVGSQTLTRLRFNFSNGTNNEVVVHAENGKSGGKVYIHRVSLKSSLYLDNKYYITVPSSDATPITLETANRLLYGFVEQIDGSDGAYKSCTVKDVTTYPESNEISIGGTLRMSFLAAIESDTVLER